MKVKGVWRLYCMRCGRELKEGQAFCNSCQELMERYPVAPGIAIHIPKRTPPSPVKKKVAHKRRDLKPEEQIARLRSTVRWLYLLLVVAVLAFSFIAAILLYTLNQQGTLLPW